MTANSRSNEEVPGPRPERLQEPPDEVAGRARPVPEDVVGAVAVEVGGERGGGRGPRPERLRKPPEKVGGRPRRVPEDVVGAVAVGVGGEGGGVGPQDV